jgi:hypothetical protein
MVRRRSVRREPARPGKAWRERLERVRGAIGKSVRFSSYVAKM